MNKNELLEKLNEIHELLKDQTKFIHLFSEDIGKKTLAKLHHLTGQVKCLLELNDAKEVLHPSGYPLRKPSDCERGSLVKIRPCDEKYGGKTYPGILIGELAIGSTLRVDEEKIQVEWSMFNPAIYVPELNEVIYGISSWWGFIKNESELREITDSDINPFWFMKLLEKQINKAEEDNGSQP